MYDMTIFHTILVDMMRRIVSDCRLTGTTISWLCVAALAAAAVPTEMTQFITPMTVWDEDNAVSAVTAELVGRNYIKGSYVDVQKKTADNADVTIVCDDAYIKNDNGYGISY